jgi:uncharacterized membrane protein
LLTDGQQVATFLSTGGQQANPRRSAVVIDEQRLEDLERRMQRIERELAPQLALRARATTTPPPTASAPPPRPPRIEPVRQAPAPRQADLEQLLGGRVLAWVGGAAVVAGLALLLALGISRGWIGEGARTLLAGALSLALLGAGVWLHERRGHAQAARAAAAAGICGLFMTWTVATAVYDLLPSGGGLTLAFATGALATVLALRWSSPLMGGLGVAGAIFAPVLVGAPGTTTTIAFEAIAVASAVAVLLRARWDWLMLTLFVLSAPQWLIWLFEARSVTEVVLVPCVFGALYAAAALGFELRAPSERLRTASTLVLALNALTLAVAGWFRLRGLGHHDLGLLWLALLAAAHVVAGLAARRSPRVTSEIGLVCLTLAVLLADVAFSLTVGGPARTAGFAVGGVVFALLARRENNGRDGILSQYGLGGHIAVSAIQALHDVTGSGSTPGTVGGLVAVAAGCLVSARLAEQGNHASRIALDALGLAAVAGIAALTLDGAALTVAWAAQAVALAKIGARRDDEVARTAAFVHLLAAGLYAVVDQAPPGALISGAGDLRAAVIGAAAVGVAAGACAIALRASDPARRVLTLAVPGVALYLASIAVVTLSPAALDGGAVQQGQLQLSALWSITGVAGLILGLRRGSRTTRLGAFGLLGLAAGKVFLYDLAALTSVYRVGSFLGLGLLLLVGALAYQRMRPQVTA